jgi:hypothetical protein
MTTQFLHPTFIVRCSSYHPAAATQRRGPSLQAFAVAISSADSSTKTRPPEFANPTGDGARDGTQRGEQPVIDHPGRPSRPQEEPPRERGGRLAWLVGVLPATVALVFLAIVLAVVLIVWLS